MSRLFLLLLALAFSPLHGGVYGTLEFGDSRETVTRKLKSSDLVEQTVDSTFLGRTGLNGVFRCKAKLGGLTYRLYFGWAGDGGLSEITLRSQQVDGAEYGTTVKAAWAEANRLFSRVYGDPVQGAHYPDKSKFGKSPILVTHMWHKGTSQTIMIGPGLVQGKGFLAVRFTSRRVEPARTP